MVTTPGWYYAIAYWLSICLIILTSPRRLKLWKSSVFMIFWGGILGTIMTLSYGCNEVLFIPFIFLYLCMIGFAIYTNCTYDLKTAIYFTARVFIIGEFAASFEWQIYFYAVNYLNVPLLWWVDVLFLIITHTIVFGILYKLERKNYEVNRNLSINTRGLISTVIITSSLFFVSNLSYVLQKSPFSSQFASEIFNIRTLVDLGGVAILYAYHVQLGELKMRFEVGKMQEMLDMQYHNYEMLGKSIAAVNQKYHDLKYHITVLKEEASLEDSRSYLEQMEQEIKRYEAQNKTGNKILDTILTGKSLYCQNSWIELTSVVDGEELDFMNPMDISSLFGNMLDNAIESVSKIEQKEKRLIHLAVKKQKGFLRIRMENCYEEDLVFEDGLPTTTKNNKQYHGYGLKSIQSTVKKYDGSVAINAKDGWFELRILIPLPKS